MKTRGNGKRHLSYWWVVSILWSYTTLGQVLTIEYNGISPLEISPHYGPDLPNAVGNAVQPKMTGSFGIANPERGLQVRGGYFDLFADGVDPFFENVNGDNSVGLDSLKNYMYKFCEDGITLVEIEQYLHFNQEALENQYEVPQNQLNTAKQLFTTNLNELGLKANFIMNSDFKYLPEALLGTDRYDEFSPINPGHFRVLGLKHFLDEMAGFYGEISPYVAVANLGWISAPYDFNTYRLSGKWNREGWDKSKLYPVYDEHQTEASVTSEFPNYNKDFYTNYHGTMKESPQRFDWNVVHKYSNPMNANSSDFAKTRKLVIDNVLEAFPHQKLLTNSLNPWASYILSTQGMNNQSGGYFGSRETINKHLLGNYGTSATGTFSPNGVLDRMYQSDKFPRIGFYDGAFGGDTYSHAWTIGNGETQEIHWLRGYKINEASIGVDYADQHCFTDPYLLRQHRSNFWQHGDLPIYESPDDVYNLTVSNPQNSWFVSTYAIHYQGLGHWYQNYGTDPYNENYDYNIGEGISSKILQNGFFSALKMRYFNFTSLGIMHNYLLDARSPYEMPDGYEGGNQNDEPIILAEGIPDKFHTAISNWRNHEVITLDELEEYGMPVSDRYFENDNESRSSYEYIRDHLGYRLELQRAVLEEDNNVQVDIVNRGFAAPQNPRDIFFCILNSEDQIVYELTTQSEGDIDWRKWQPDEFAISHSGQIGSNYTYNTFNYSDTTQFSQYGNNLDNVVIGGIPLGEFESDWHHDPLGIEYQPIVYSFSSQTIPNQFMNSNFRIGIRLPDPSPLLKENPKYAVKFANMAKYIPCNGVTVLMTLGEEHAVSSQVDSDGDGVPNFLEEEDQVYNPINLEVEDLERSCLNCDHHKREEVEIGEPQEPTGTNGILSPLH